MSFGAPVVYLAAFAGRNSEGHHGPGNTYRIMAKPRPRYGELGDGWVQTLMPRPDWLDAVRSRRWSAEQYENTCRRLFERNADRRLLLPGQLRAVLLDGSFQLVQDGDTLCCSCGRKAAAAGRCHRVWAADYLIEAGWRVILDAQEVTS